MLDVELKEFLEYKVNQYNKRDFITDDPISVPHRFTIKEDIEIAAFLVSLISWGNRKVIVRNGHKMIDRLGTSPYDFVMSHRKKDLENLNGFVHRTFNEIDFKQTIIGLKNIYQKYQGLEEIFTKNSTLYSTQPAIVFLKKVMFENAPLSRSVKHLPDPSNGSAAKKINMFLRWMIRKDNKGVDFGIWNISPSKLSCPLDVHSGNIARKLGILLRKQNDSKAVQQLDTALRILDNDDPVKYDYALFGLGIFEKSII